LEAQPEPVTVAVSFTFFLSSISLTLLDLIQTGNGHGRLRPDIVFLWSSLSHEPAVSYQSL
jgi:hypothetical protein